MKVHVASQNPVKVLAVETALLCYDLFKEATVVSFETDSGVSEQPRSLEETIRGAMNRAKHTFPGSNYSFGIESGLMEVPHTTTGMMDFCACAIYDGSNHHIGLSCAFEFPPQVTRLIEEGYDASQAFYISGLTRDQNIGSSEGAIGILTGGIVTRTGYTEQAIHMAMVQVMNPNLYHE